MPTPDFTSFPIPTVLYQPVSPSGLSGQVQYNNGGTFGGLTNAQLTGLITPFSASASGAVLASGGGSTNFLRADGTWAVPTGGTADPLSLTLGYQLNITNPTVDVFFGNSNVGSYSSVTSTNLNNLNPDFTNLEANHYRLTSYNVDITYSANTQCKTTQYVHALEGNFYSGAQRFLSYWQALFNGMGDAGIWNVQSTFAGGPIPGDEGIGYTPVIRQNQSTEDLRTTISNVHRALGNTTITPAITRSKDPQTKAVASTANINAGEWYVVEHQIAAPEYNCEAVKIISVGAGTITARFRQNHPAGVTLTPALVFAHSSPSPGQLRVVVNLSGASYTTGQITGTFGAGALTGSGTNFTLGIVGGDVKNIGAIALARDTFTGSPFSVGNPCKSWYEINQVNSTTQINIVSMSVADDRSYRSSRGAFPSNFEIRPAVRILWIDVEGGFLVCDTTSTVWNNGDTIEIARCPYPDITMFGLGTSVYTAGATFRGGISVATSGPVPCQGAGFSVGGTLSGFTSDQPYGWNTGIALGTTVCPVRVGVAATTTESGIELSGLTKTKAPIKFLQSGLAINENANDGISVSYLNAAAVIIGSPPNTAGNADVNLNYLLLDKTHLEITGVGGVALPYVQLSSLKVQAISNVDTTTRNSVIETPSGSTGANLTGSGNTVGASIHNSGLGTNGCLQTARSDITCTNGANGNIQLVTATSFVRITGPTGAFSISGFQEIGGGIVWGLSSHVAGDGTILRIFNATAQNMTLINDSGTTQSILTLTGADVVLTGTSAATLIYSGTDQRWILMGTQG